MRVRFIVSNSMPASPELRRLRTLSDRAHRFPDRLVICFVSGITCNTASRGKGECVLPRALECELPSTYSQLEHELQHQPRVVLRVLDKPKHGV